MVNILFEDMCPFGHKNIDKVDLGHRAYIFCYDCKKQFIGEDYD